MADEVAVAEIVRTGLAAHPAVRAWRRLGTDAVPREVRILKERSKGIRKSAVYWLAGAAPGGASVVAKLAKRAAVTLEALIYRDALPGLPVDALRFYGLLDEGAPFVWLFLSDAEGEPYSPRRDEHRRAAARWLATLHASAVGLPQAAALPDRGPEHVLGQLRSGRTAIAGVVGHSGLGREQAAILVRLDELLEGLESRWDEVVADCDLLPRTLVHGDFVRKNLRVRRGDTKSVLLAFDWERAGWGTPAVDLAQLWQSERFSANACLDTYHATLGARGLEVDRGAVEVQAAAGTAFRCLAGIAWTGVSLSADWLHHPLSYLVTYARWLEDAVQAAGWEVGSPARA